MSELLDVFINESRENLESASRGLLTIQSSSSHNGIIDGIFRDIHTIKGSSDLFDIKPLTALAHAAEDLLDCLRASEVVYTEEIGDLLLEVLDQISSWFDELELGTENMNEWKPVSVKLSDSLRAFINADNPKVTSYEEHPHPVSSSSENVIGNIASESPGAGPFTSTIGTFTSKFSSSSAITLLAKTQSENLYLIDYQPDHDCFFRGEDPFNVLITMPGLLGFKAAFPLLTSESDIYESALSFVAIGEADISEIDSHMAYYEGQYHVSHISRRELALSCAAEIRDAVEKLANESLLIAIEDGELEQIQSVAELLQTSGNHDPMTNAVLCYLAKGNEYPANSTQAHMQGSVKQESLQLTDNKHVKSVSLYEVELLQQQRKLLDAEYYNRELMLPSVANLTQQLLCRFAIECDLTCEESIRNAIDRALSVASTPLENSQPENDSNSIDVDSHNRHASSNSPAEEGAKSERHVVKMLKVDQEKIDYLMDIVGELAVAKNSLPYLAKQAEKEGGSKALSKQIKSHFSIVNRLTESLQSAVLQIRMVPVSHVFERYPRLVRDLARKLNKKIELVMSGEDTEFDKNLIESLSEPLIHLLRNSIDHGIELPDLRIQQGKAEKGRIDLIATPLDDSVVIEIRDDGKGIDPEKLKMLAFQKGIITEHQLETMNDDDALQLIFAPGFSTNEEVSDLSGRGVGMDAVRTMVNQAGGKIEMSSELGIGTTFKLLLPQTMSVNHVMMFEVADQMFAVSMDAVVETVKVHRSEIQRIRKQNVLVIRDKLIPLCELRSALGFENQEKGEECSILIVTSPTGEHGLVIDKFHEGIDVIQKPLEGVLSGYSHFSGTALLGDGRVLLIVNIQEILACH
jgi:two-component system chemotaxis sensor kinase CheA